MTSSSENGFYLSENFTYTSNKESLLNQMNETYQKIARASNAKEIAIYSEEEVITGQTFPGDTPQTKKIVYRKTFVFGAIAAGATLNIPHSISGATLYVNINGGVVTSVPDFRPIPYVSTTATDQLSVRIDATNIILVNGATGANIVSGICYLEYIRS